MGGVDGDGLEVRWMFGGRRLGWLGRDVRRPLGATAPLLVRMSRLSLSLFSDIDAPNEVSDAQQHDQTMPPSGGDANIISSPNHWPLHARICRTLTENGIY